MNINILKKWNEQYLRLSSFNRKARRTLKKRWKKSLLVIALALALGVSDASAATINVGETSTGIGAVTIDDTDNICSITEALQNANDTSGIPPNDDCETGDSATGMDGADIIELPSNSTFTFDGVNPPTFGGIGQNALPAITSNITIEGNGSILERSLASGTPNFRFFTVQSTFNLNINKLALRNGRSGRGGCIFNNVGNLSVNNSEISGCNATNSGGAIYNYAEGNVTASMNLVNSTISGNDALNRGGGIYGDVEVGGNANIVFNIINSTITNNIAFEGPGVFLRTYQYSNPSELNSRNSIISGNLSTIGNNADCFTIAQVIITDLGNNLSDDTSCEFTENSSYQNFDNNCLGPLTNNGGTTLTNALLDPNDPNTPSTCNQNPAIDGGDNAVCAGPEVNNLDQRGVMRPFPVGGVCDIGSFELQPTGSGMCNMAEIPGDGVDNNGDGDGTTQ